MTAVAIQSNKIVSNEVKDSLVLLEPSYRNKTKQNKTKKPNFWPTQYILIWRGWTGFILCSSSDQTVGIDSLEPFTECECGSSLGQVRRNACAVIDG